MSGSGAGEPETEPRPPTPLERHLCQVGGANQNYCSTSGTRYHIQIEDRGPVLDAVSEEVVRRVNVIIYTDYGEQTARIIHGRDHDFPDIRTQAHNRFIERKIQELAAEARGVIEDKERRLVARIKASVRLYYETKSDAVKREFEEANATYPFLFSKAWAELKAERNLAVPTPPTRPAADPDAASEAGAEAEGALEAGEVVYPMEPELLAHVLEIERLIIELGRDLQRLRSQGGTDDILLQTCRKLVTRARQSLTVRDSPEFTARRLDSTRNSLITTWKQVRSRLR